MKYKLRLDRLEHLLAGSRVSQNHWAMRLGLSRGHWSDLRSGRHLFPSARTRQRLIEAFGVAENDLFELVAGAEDDEYNFRRAIAARFELTSELGQGGMGAVYLANDLTLGRVVAVKLVAAEAVAGVGASHVVQEIALVSRLQHRNILPLYDAGERAGSPFYVMPWIRGGSLGALLRSRARLPLPEALDILDAIAAGLHHAHEHHVLHCDIKPENILVDEDGHVFVMDFGIARKLHSEATEWSAVRKELDFSAGTPDYVSPEQASGTATLTRQSDIYSLGCVAYEMLAGRTPFRGESTRQIVSRRFTEKPPSLRKFAPDVPAAVADVIDRAMSLEPTERPETARAFVAELRVAAREAVPWRMTVSVGRTRIARRLRTATVGPVKAREIRMPFRTLLTDVRVAARGLARTPTVALSAVLCLVLGIGATGAISSAISRALMQRPPIRDPDRLVAVHRVTPNSGPLGTWPHSPANYIDLSQRSRQVTGLSALWSFGSALVHMESDAFQASRVKVSGTLFPMLGLTNVRGRIIGVDDDRPESAPVVMVSDNFWHSRLGGDPDVVGRTLRIDGEPVTIIGVTPPDFRIPFATGMFRGDLWMPLRFTPGQAATRNSNFLQMIGRLAPGATPQSAEAELKSLFSALRDDYPFLNGEDVRVGTIRLESVQSLRRPLFLLFGAVIMVLLIAATNVAALLLARGVNRRREMAVRAALGASRRDAIRLAMTESVLITAIGVAGGIALSVAGVKTIGALASARIPQLAGLSVDKWVIALALVLAVVVAIVCGVVPAMRGAAVDPQDALRGGRGAGTGREHHRALRSLVVVEISLSLVLLIGAGLVLKAFASLLGYDPGFDASRILAVQVTTSAARYQDRPAARAFLEPALTAIQNVPGVEAAGAITAMPYVSWGNNGGIRYEGRPKLDPTRLPIVENRGITPEFFAATRQRLVSGRLLSASDDRQSPPVVVVNQALVKRDFGGRDPVGTRYHLDDTTFATIVGVVTDIRNAGPVVPPAPEMYYTYAQGAAGNTNFPIMVRARGRNPMQVAAGVRAAIRGVDETAAIGTMRPMREVIVGSLGRPQFYFSLLACFAAVAVLLTVAGLYGVLSYAVAQRTREIGIRTALGSSRLVLMRMVTAEGMKLVGVGVLLGLAGGFAVTRLMTSMLYDVSPLDITAWAAAVGVMGVVAAFATLIPAFRASRVDPMEAMRAE